MKTNIKSVGLTEKMMLLRPEFVARISLISAEIDS